MSIIICLAIITIYSVVRLVLYWIHKDKAIGDFNDGRCFCGDVFKFSRVDFKYNVHFKCRNAAKK